MFRNVSWFTHYSQRRLEWLLAFYTLFFGRRASDNYWNVQPQTMTLEWTLSSPPPFHQFETLPVIKDTGHH